MTKITYNGKTTELADGYIATLPCKDLKMETDVVVEAPEPAEISDSPLPIEVSTEAEMTALLTSGEIGGVYKYVGETTDAYENGALYVLEEETAIGTFTHQYTGESTDTTTYEFEVGMTWREWVDSAYNTTSGASSIFINNSLAYRGGGSGNYPLRLNGVAVYADDLIVADATYTSQYTTGGGGSGD